MLDMALNPLSCTVSGYRDLVSTLPLFVAFLSSEDMDICRRTVFPRCRRNEICSSLILKRDQELAGQIIGITDASPPSPCYL